MDRGLLRIFDVLAGAALRIADFNHNETPLQILERVEGTELAMPEALAHLRRLLAVPDDMPARLSARMLLTLVSALVSALHSRLGAGSAVAFAMHDVLEKIACESGLRSERETYAQVARWQAELAQKLQEEIDENIL